MRSIDIIPNKWTGPNTGRVAKQNKKKVHLVLPISETLLGVMTNQITPLALKSLQSSRPISGTKQKKLNELIS